MRRVTWTARIALLGIATAAVAGKKPSRISEENLAELRTVKTLFVDGNSEAAEKFRDNVEKYTCLRLVNNPAKADATLSVGESARRQYGILVGNQNRVSASVLVTMTNGNQVWSGNKLGSDGFVHSGAGGASVAVLRALAKDACPGWGLKNEAGHRPYARTEIAAP